MTYAYYFIDEEITGQWSLPNKKQIWMDMIRRHFILKDYGKMGKRLLQLGDILRAGS